MTTTKQSWLEKGEANAAQNKVVESHIYFSASPLSLGQGT